MKTNASMKATLRQPLKMLLLLVLVGLISFATIARAVEYVIVNNESGQIGRYYKAIGSLVPDDPANLFMTEQLASVLSGSQYVDYEDYRRHASGVIEGIVNTDFSGLTSDHSYDLVYNRARTFYPDLPALYNMSPQTTGVHVSDIIVYAVFDSLFVNSGPIIAGTSVLYFTIDEVVAGHPECAPSGKYATILYPPTGGVLDFMMRGADNVLNEDGTSRNAGDVFGDLIPGERYLIKVYLDRGYYGNYSVPATVVKTLLLSPLTKDGLWYLPAPEGESIDFDAPELAGLKNDIERLNINLSSFQVITTKDMSAMPMMQEEMQSFYLTDGRWLNRGDDINGRRVCVIHDTVAEARGLSVGDTIKMTLRDMQSGNFGYITDEMGDSWRDLPTVEEELVIVGLYSNYGRGSADFTMDTLCVYIPDSVMPAEFGGESAARVAPHKVTRLGAPERFLTRNSSEWNYEGLESGGVTQLMAAADEIMYAPNYSFVLKSNDDKQAFLDECGQQLAALGFSVSFSPNNAAVFKAAIEPVLWSTGINAVLFSILLILALALAVFLYLQQHRREFVIARALGVPTGRAVRHLLSPLALVGGLGILAGGILSWNYAVDKSVQTLASVFEQGGVERTGSLSSWWLAGFLAVCFTLLLAFALIGSAQLARRPVLAQLQGGAHSHAARKPAKIPARAARTNDSAQEQGVAIAREMVIVPALPKDIKPPLFIPQARHVVRRIRRSPFKSLLVVLVAAVYTVSTGWIQNTIYNSELEIDRLYSSIEIKAEILKVDMYHASEDSAPILQTPVSKIYASGMVASSILVANSPPEVAYFREEDGGFSEKIYVPPALTFYAADSYFERGGSPSVECKNLVAFDRHELFFGDIGAGITNIEYAQGYDESIFLTDWTDEFPVIISRADFEQLGEQLGGIVSFYFYNRDGSNSRTAVIAGVYDGDVSLPESSVLMPMSAYTRLQNGTLRYVTAKFVFDATRNREFAEIRDELQAVISKRIGGFPPTRMLIQDEELRHAITPLDKTLSLMTILYPVTIGVVSLIAAGLSLLLVLLLAKDVAIMRVLGTTKLKTRTALLFEQTVLCIIGLTLGSGVAAILFGKISIDVLAIYLAACIVAVAYGAHNVTRNKPLELLQVKE